MNACRTMGCCAWLLASLVAASEPARPPIRLTTLHPLQRIGLDDAPHGAGEVRIAAAKNEVESFQVVVTAGEETVRVTTAELSELRHGDGSHRIGPEHVRVYREEYVRVRQASPRAELPPGLYPDPLVPFVNPWTGKPIEPRRRYRPRWGEPVVETGYDMYGLPFEVFRGQNQPLWIDVRVPADAPAGLYRGEFRVRAAGGVEARLPVSLEVWNFTLPDGPTHRNHFGSFRNISHYFGVARDSDAFRQIELRYCEAMAEHRLNPPIPDSLLPDVGDDGSLEIDPRRTAALRRFIERLHVTDFEIPRCPFARLPSSTTRPDYKTISPENRQKALRYYRQYDAYVRQNGWGERAYVYLWDEPNLKENYEQVLVLGQLVREAAPKLRRLVVEQPYPQDPSWPDIDPAVDIWCPLWAFIDRDAVRAKIAGGDEVWSYTALAQRAPQYHPHYEQVKDKDPPYWHIDRPPIVYRIPTWVNRQYGITGLLYWTTMTRVIDPWNLPAFAHPRHYNGGGYLFYPGTPCGIAGPVPCIRLKNLRDGMEDYEYFALLDRLAGPAATQAVVDRVAPNWWDDTRDPEVLFAARRALAEAIERAQSR